MVISRFGADEPNGHIPIGRFRCRATAAANCSPAPTYYLLLTADPRHHTMGCVSPVVTLTKLLGTTGWRRTTDRIRLRKAYGATGFIGQMGLICFKTGLGTANGNLLAILLSSIAEEVLEKLAAFLFADTGSNQATMV